MADRSDPINAIVYAQYHLKGGAKNTLIGMGVGLLVVGGACATVVSMNPHDTRDVATGCAMMILAIQWLVLGLYGTSRVSAAVRQDVAGGLIESHRLTPASPIGSAVGYVLGPPIQALGMSAVLLVVGLVMGLIGRVPATFWLVANGMTLAFAMTMWTLVALIAFTATNAAVLPIVAISSFMSIGLFMILPATSVLTAPFVGQLGFLSRRGGVASLPPAYAFTLVSQGLLAGVMLLAIARRYRSADTPAFSVPLGFVLLTIWTAITVIGLVQTRLFMPTPIYGRSSDEDVSRLIAGLVSSLLVALVPLTAIARRMAGGVRAAETAGPARAGSSAWVSVVGCAALASVPSLQQWIDSFGLGEPQPFRALGTLAVALAMFAGLTLTLAWQFLAGRGGWLFAFLYILLPNAVPPILDAALHAAETSSRSSVSTLTGFSPLGSLIMLWDRRPHDLVPGLVGQGLLVLLPLTLYLMRRYKRSAGPRGFAVALTTPPAPAE